jgi:hypothetical protein
MYDIVHDRRTYSTPRGGRPIESTVDGVRWRTGYLPPFVNIREDGWSAIRLPAGFGWLHAGYRAILEVIRAYGRPLPIDIASDEWTVLRAVLPRTAGVPAVTSVWAPGDMEELRRAGVRTVVFDGGTMEVEYRSSFTAVHLTG